MLYQYHPPSTECYTFTLENFFCRICTIVSITEVNCKERSSVPIDPSNFQWALKCKISSICSAPFDFNAQQDFAEILLVVSDELKRTSIRADNFHSNTLTTTITCNSYFCSTVKEEKLDIVLVPTPDNVNTSLEKFLSSELMKLENEWFCP